MPSTPWTDQNQKVWVIGCNKGYTSILYWLLPVFCFLLVENCTRARQNHARCWIKMLIEKYANTRRYSHVGCSKEKNLYAQGSLFALMTHTLYYSLCILPQTHRVYNGSTFTSQPQNSVLNNRMTYNIHMYLLQSAPLKSYYSTFIQYWFVQYNIRPLRRRRHLWK